MDDAWVTRHERVRKHRDAALYGTITSSTTSSTSNGQQAAAGGSWSWDHKCWLHYGQLFNTPTLHMVSRQPGDGRGLIDLDLLV